MNEATTPTLELSKLEQAYQRLDEVFGTNDEPYLISAEGTGQVDMVRVCICRALQVGTHSNRVMNTNQQLSRPVNIPLVYAHGFSGDIHMTTRLGHGQGDISFSHTLTAAERLGIIDILIKSRCEAD